MARIINVEKSKYINDSIKIYSSNKVGQYSKFLDKTPVFVTYYSINQVMSRTDVGTGGISVELGPNSPIRFNKIKTLPMYNIPTLNPDINYDETGYDIELDLNDWTVLPNTVKPTPGEYIIVSLPGTKEFLFRVNNFRYNTIQSNDFYQLDADLKAVGTNLETTKFGSSQIVETYETIFENIGTESKCFLRSDDIPKLETIAKVFTTVRDFYYDNFFDKLSGSFILRNDPLFPEYIFYDMYLNKFIMDSEIYYSDTKPDSIILTCNDTEPVNMNALFSRTLEYAVLNRTDKYLCNYLYYYQRDILKQFSPFVMNRINAKGVDLIVNESAMADSVLADGFISYYYSKELVQAIKTSSEFVTTDYLEQIIYKYMISATFDIDLNSLVEYMISPDLYSYLYLPLVMYIIMKYYDSYFVKDEL